MKLVIKLVLLAIIVVVAWFAYETINKPEDLNKLLTKETVQDIKSFAAEKIKSIDTDKLQELIVNNKDAAIDYINENKDSISMQDFEEIKEKLKDVLSEKQIEELKKSIQSR